MMIEQENKRIAFIKKNMINRAVTFLIALCLFLSPAAFASAETGEIPSGEQPDRQITEASQQDEEKSFPYVHDPRDNADAMKDIVYLPEAVYCFAPSPDSARLKVYADAIDWTDPEQVAEARAVREEYHESLSELYQMITDMLHEAKPVEEIARAVSQRRNELRLEVLKDDPENLALTKKSNLETYGHEEGPTPDELYEKYGSWQTVLEKALGTNPGMDACVGLYDEYYDYYDIEETPEAEDLPK